MTAGTPHHLYLQNICLAISRKPGSIIVATGIEIISAMLTAVSSLSCKINFAKFKLFSLERNMEMIIARTLKNVQKKKVFTSSVGEFIIPGYNPVQPKSRRINGTYTV